MHRIPRHFHENHENLIIQCQNYENLKIHKIPTWNYENHEKK